MRKIDLVVGVRPDFIRAAALNSAFSSYEDTIDLRIIHTGQHYDPELSQDLLEQLHLDHISTILPFEGGEEARQLAVLMIAYEDQIKFDPPDLLLVIGNSNSALASALVASRHGIPMAHIDAGIRDFTPVHIEEQNDLLIDRLAQILFTSNEESVINLIREGIDNSQIIEVGNIRADAVFMNLGYAEDSNILDRSGLREGAYILMTLHHNHTLQQTDFLVSLFTMLEELSERLLIHVVLHPKAMNLLEDIPGLILEFTDNLQLVSSRNYHDMLKLLKYAALVLTDSQGLQEESTVLGIPCLTIGHQTNRPITLARGTNSLVGFDIDEIRTKILSIMEGEVMAAHPVNGWDGKAGQRIAKFISDFS
ncbi:MAG: UDP-N-acetylglucosamine 2-epimerase [Candidatus Marinimicrobia bacterium]|nr:UDP-N-acetylglucosamine 2-epimerase [Candidatus Neomarinimicrobiota bacterium]